MSKHPEDGIVARTFGSLESCLARLRRARRLLALFLARPRLVAGWSRAAGEHWQSWVPTKQHARTCAVMGTKRRNASRSDHRPVLRLLSGTFFQNLNIAIRYTVSGYRLVVTLVALSSTIGVSPPVYTWLPIIERPWGQGEESRGSRGCSQVWTGDRPQPTFSMLSAKAIVSAWPNMPGSPPVWMKTVLSPGEMSPRRAAAMRPAIALPV
jgi:hypothetical protein